MNILEVCSGCGAVKKNGSWILGDEPATPDENADEVYCPWCADISYNVRLHLHTHPTPNCPV